MLLGSLAALGMVAYVPSVWLSIQVGAWAIAVADTLAYALILVAFLTRGLRYDARAGVLLAAAYLLGAMLVFMFGPVSAGPLWLCAVPVLTAALFERRAMVWSLAVTALTLLAAAVLFGADVLDWGESPAALPLFAVISGNLLLLAGGLALAVSALIRGLRESAERAERLAVELRREQEALERANELLTREMAEHADAEARLRQSEKLTALGTLAGGIAHNLNNLLTPLLMGVELLKAERKPAAGADELLEQMEGAATGARDVVRQILTFARALPEARGAADAATAFREAAQLLAASLPASIELVTELDPSAGAIALSTGDAHQILLNLGTNAMHAMPDGGEIRVSLVGGCAAPSDDPSVEHVCLTVRDHGTGMDELTRQRAIEPFFTTKPPGRGTGLGLATVHGMVRAAGGALQIESAPGAGTTVRVYLPRLASPELPDAIPRPAFRTPASRQVLVVDDDAAVRAIAQAFLERTGWKVREASTVEEALAVLDGTGARLDLLITDLNMPGENGIELVREALQRRPDLLVVLMSGFLDEAHRDLAVSAGAAAIISKPFRIVELQEAIARAVDGGERLT